MTTREDACILNARDYLFGGYLLLKKGARPVGAAIMLRTYNFLVAEELAQKKLERKRKYDGERYGNKKASEKKRTG